MAFPCALGPAGTVTTKREGDGGTPRGRLALRRLFRRADRGPRPPSGLDTRTIRTTDGWCDAPGHRRYNRLITLPFSASHETLWRDDGLYDLVVELGWNDRPATPGRGSAIFLHAAAPASRRPQAAWRWSRASSAASSPASPGAPGSTWSRVRASRRGDVNPRASSRSI
ncbi:L,D-transpeptidase family protein [Chenggangzhangella methanolivorans]|uniref:L,D-transpeptidase family protein n=1 Tax=Chenggangzhangella methanolivorans TaxID=1437009 RepID=UPI003D1672F1